MSVRLVAMRLADWIELYAHPPGLIKPETENSHTPTADHGK